MLKEVTNKEEIDKMIDIYIKDFSSYPGEIKNFKPYIEQRLIKVYRTDKHGAEEKVGLKLLILNKEDGLSFCFYGETKFNNKQRLVMSEESIDFVRGLDLKALKTLFGNGVKNE